jgi:hypothetical protein
VAHAKKAVTSDSESSDESKNNMESRIPCKKKRVAIKNIRYNSKEEVVDIKDSESEDDQKMPAQITSRKTPRRSLMPWTRTLSPVKMRTPRLSKKKKPINLLVDTAEISWDNAKIHMQHQEMLIGNWVDALEQEILYAHDRDTTDAERIQGIIESKYTPADLSKIVEECTHLEKAEQKQILLQLQKYEDLFDGSKGTWITDPIQLE